MLAEPQDGMECPLDRLEAKRSAELFEPVPATGTDDAADLLIFGGCGGRYVPAIYIVQIPITRN